MKRKHNIVSLFAGCGGLDLGFRNAGFNVSWANEIMPDVAKSYQANIGHEPIVGDIWNIMDTVPKADIVIGGPPCQAFSLVGKRLDNDPRAKLVFAYKIVIERTLPKVFVMENVPGLMASKIDDRSLVGYLQNEYEKLGYSVSVNKLLASDYFVPQQRKRVVMVGILNGARKFQMLSANEFRAILGLEGQQLPVSTCDALDDLPAPLPKRNYGAQPYAKSPHSGYAKLMRKHSEQSVTFQTMPTMSKLDQEFVKYIPPGGNYMNIPDSLSTPRIVKFKTTGGRTTTYGRLHPDCPAYTINTYFNRPNVGANYHYSEERLITVREALRLQSFPDDFIPVYSNQRNLHIQIGNAVPPLLAQAIAESLKKVMDK